MNLVDILTKSLAWIFGIFSPSVTAALLDDVVLDLACVDMTDRLWPLLPDHTQGHESMESYKRCLTFNPITAVSSDFKQP